MRSFQFFIIESAAIQDISHWKQTGHALGSNPGGVHEDEHGVKHYVKFPHNPEQAHQEVASAKIHELLGVKTLKPKLISKNGKVGTATKWNPDLETKPPKHFENLSKSQAKAVAHIHHAGVLTKNWDTVGLEHDNITFHKKTGAIHAVDQGGSFKFRAQGGHKDYGKDIGEIHSYRDEDINHAAAHVFHHAFTKHPGIEKEALTHARKITYNQVHSALKSSGVKDHKNMADTFMKRKELLLKHYGE